MEVMGAGLGVGSVRGIFAGPKVDGQFRMSDSASRCSSDVLLYERTPSKLLCPVHSIICCSSTPDWYRRLADVARKEWLVLKPEIPADRQSLAPSGLCPNG